MEDTPQRIVNFRNKHFRNREQLRDYLLDKTSGWRGKLIIMAGHYALMYRRGADKLVPMIKSVVEADPDASPEERTRIASVRDFPEETFEVAVMLVQRHPEMEPRIALLVNDRYFHMRQLGQNDLSPAKLAGLKRDYYHLNAELPGPFRAILARVGRPEQVLLSNDADRKAGHTLPARTFYFSENVMRNRFFEKKKDFLKYPGFKSVPNLYNDTPKLVYRSLYEGNDFCVVDDPNEIGCSGVMLEFLLTLREKGADNLILFIPDECREQVHSSIVATMGALVPFENVIAVWSNGEPDEGVLLSGATTYSLSEGGAVHYPPR